MVILPGWEKWRPSWDCVSGVGDVVPTCIPCYVEVPVLGGIPVLGGCLVQLLGAWVLVNLNPRVGWRALLRCLVHLK